MKSGHKLVLASASPRRLALLRRLGLDPAVCPVEMEELQRPGEAPARFVSRLAEEKCRRAAAARPADDPPALILAADTAVVIGGRILGKPRDSHEAEEMLRLLRGKSHEVMTGVHMLRTDDGRCAGGVEVTAVRFRDYDDDTLRAYVASGEPLDKAGGYGIQGAGVALAADIEGSWSNVVGLPLERLQEWIGRLDLDLERLA
jgi:septum formation protein